MALIEWRDDFRTGIADVDYEHKQLIDTINALYDKASDEGSKEAVLGFFGDLHGRISAHFALEEVIMHSADYDEFDAHKAEHEHLLDEIRDIMDNYEVGAYAAYGDVLAEHLRTWFLEHFRTMDARLHRILG